MVNANEARAAFAGRLEESLARVGCPASPTQFSRSFNLQYPDMAVTIHGARKWLMGESMPVHTRILALARWFQVDAAWLQFGDPVKAPNTKLITPTDGLDMRVNMLTAEERKLVRGFVDLILKARTAPG